jgi:hypothetical protein
VDPFDPYAVYPSDAAFTQAMRFAASVDGYMDSIPLSI